MKLLRLPLVLVWVGLAQEPTAPAPPHQSEQTAIPATGIHPYQAFPQGGRGSGVTDNEPKTGSDLDVTAIQRKGTIKADHKKNLDDAVALLKLAEDLKSELEKEDPLIISVKNIKQTEDIQKLAKNIHGRLKRY